MFQIGRFERIYSQDICLQVLWQVSWTGLATTLDDFGISTMCSPWSPHVIEGAFENAATCEGTTCEAPQITKRSKRLSLHLLHPHTTTYDYLVASIVVGWLRRSLLANRSSHDILGSVARSVTSQNTKRLQVGRWHKANGRWAPETELTMQINSETTVPSAISILESCWSQNTKTCSGHYFASTISLYAAWAKSSTGKLLGRSRSDP